MHYCSHCKASVALNSPKCPKCGLDFYAFTAEQKRKANSWMIGGFIAIMIIFSLISAYAFLLAPLGLLGIAVLLFCAIKSEIERRKKPVIFLDIFN